MGRSMRAASGREASPVTGQQPSAHPVCRQALVGSLRLPRRIQPPVHCRSRRARRRRNLLATRSGRDWSTRCARAHPARASVIFEARGRACGRERNLKWRDAAIREPPATGRKLGGVALVGRCEDVSRAAAACAVIGRRCCRRFGGLLCRRLLCRRLLCRLLLRWRLLRRRLLRWLLRRLLCWRYLRRCLLRLRCGLRCGLGLGLGLGRLFRLRLGL